MSMYCGNYASSESSCRNLLVQHRKSMYYMLERWVRRFSYFGWASNSLSQRSFVSSWQSSMRVHEVMTGHRIKFSQRLNEMGDELSIIRFKRVLQKSNSITVLRGFDAGRTRTRIHITENGRGAQRRSSKSLRR